MSNGTPLFPLVAASAAALMGGLVLLQTDSMSRRLLLDESQLDRKRRNEYTYAWRTSIQKVLLLLDYNLAGGMENYKEDPAVVWKSMEYLENDDDLGDLIRRIIEKNSQDGSRYFVVKIDRDPHDPTDEFYLFLLQEKGQQERVLYELPLMKFGLKLAQAFEDQVTTTTLCFVADASSGKATSMLESLVNKAKTGVAVLSEPFWMVQVARLVEAAVFPSAKIQKLLFALCRLDAWSLRRECQDSRTVMITLPGQATTATLLPLVQQTFPEDRHVFAYDDCVASVQSGMYERRRYRWGQIQHSLESILYGMCQDPVRHTTPLPSNSPLTKDASLGALRTALAKVPVTEARVVETWMSSVDTYLQLKQKESINGYLPYVFKLGLLSPSPMGNFEPRSDSHWSLTSLLQFITGCRSGGLSEGVLDAAKEWLKDYNAEQVSRQVEIERAVPISETDRKAMENCVFQHKSILIGNKTLQDTVLPREHWTLKQATRAGCSCCGPDPYDQEEKDEEDSFAVGEESKSSDGRGGGMDMNVPGAFASAFKKQDSPATNQRPTPATKANSFVDGKQGFAFDPTRFAT